MGTNCAILLLLYYLKTMPQAQPPAQYQPAPNTYDSTNANDLRSEANGENTNVISTEGSLSAVQVNNFNDSELFIEGVGRRPIASLNATIYVNDNGSSIGGAITFSTPLGGRSTNQFNTLAQARIQREQTAAINQLIKNCIGLRQSGITITNAASPELIAFAQSCRGIALAPAAASAIDKLEAENKALRDKLIERNTRLLQKRG